MTDERDLLGQGLSFPPRLGPDGRFAWSAGSDNIRECIAVVLATNPNERTMLPSFGAGLRTFLNEPNVASTHRLIQERVAGALARWEPRISVEQIEVVADPVEQRQATVTVSYTLVATGERGRLGITTPVGG